MASLTLSPDIFFLIEDESVLLWNPNTHKQYLLSPENFLCLLNLSTLKKKSPHLHQQLLDANIITYHPAKLPAWGWDQLSKIFHKGTRDVPCIEMESNEIAYTKNYLAESGTAVLKAPSFFKEISGETVVLPKPNIKVMDLPFHQAVTQRKTCREFFEKPITLLELSNLLFSSFGLIHEAWSDTANGLAIAGLRKAAASSGGVHAEEAYVSIFNVTGISPGIYHYNVKKHALVLIKPGQFEETCLELNRKQFFSKNISVGIYITMRLERYWWKYEHSRSYRIMLLDAGHISQTFLLNATALGLSTWITGAFDDSKIEALLNVDGNAEPVVLFLGVGHGSNESIPTTFKAL